MNVLILGSGGREHAFAWKIAKSSSFLHDFWIFFEVYLGLTIKCMRGDSNLKGAIQISSYF